MILVGCGAREWTDGELTHHTLVAFKRRTDGDLLVISGGARGADRIVRQWALANNVENEEIKADWTKGSTAGAVRNLRMLALAEDLRRARGPILTVAFKDGLDRRLRSGTTEHLVRVALRHGHSTLLIAHGAKAEFLHPALVA